MNISIEKTTSAKDFIFERSLSETDLTKLNCENIFCKENIVDLYNVVDPKHWRSFTGWYCKDCIEFMKIKAADTDPIKYFESLLLNHENIVRKYNGLEPKEKLWKIDGWYFTSGFSPIIEGSSHAYEQHDNMYSANATTVADTVSTREWDRIVHISTDGTSPDRIFIDEYATYDATTQSEWESLIQVERSIW